MTASIVIIFLMVEVLARLICRSLIDSGGTYHVMGAVYLTNATNLNSSLFGVGTVVLLIFACFVFLSMLAGFIFIGKLNGWADFKSIKSGVTFSALLLSIATLNMLESAFMGGVTDYLAFINLKNNSAKVINLADVVLFISLVGVFISGLWFLATITYRELIG